MNTSIQLIKGEVVITNTQNIPQDQYIAQQEALITQLKSNIANLEDSIANIGLQIDAAQALIDQVS